MASKNINEESKPMKLLLGLLIMGAVLIGGGVGLRQSGIRMQTAEYQKTYGTLALSKGVTQEAAGLGLISLGSGLMICGVVFMILERHSKDTL
jgi:hypothetical protein